MQKEVLYIDGAIGAESGGFLFFEDTFSLKKLNSFIDNSQKETTEFEVRINSGGGEINEGFAIYDKLRNSTKSITTIAEGMVGSIATIIYLAGSVRKMYKNSKFFIHNPYWQPFGGEALEAEDLKKMSQELEYEEERILNFYVEKTGSDKEELRVLMQNQTSLTAEEALRLGFVTEIIEEKVNSKQRKLLAYKNFKPQNMNTEITKKLNFIERLFKSTYKKQIMNMDLTVRNSSGDEVKMFIDTDTEDLVDKAAFEIDAEGNQSVAKDGKYTDDEGREITIEAGMVKEVVVPTDELEASRQENEALKAEIETLKTSLQNAVNENAEFVNNLKKVEVEFQNFKKQIIGGEIKIDVADIKKPIEQNQNKAEYGNYLLNKIKK